MADAGEERTIAERHADAQPSRRRPGFGWLVALVAVPLLLAVIGWVASRGAAKTPEVAAPSVVPSATLTVPATPPASSSAAAGGRFGAMSIVRTGNGFTLTGEVPDDATKAALSDTIRQAMPGATIVTDLTVTPGVKTPEIAGLGALFGAAVDVEGFSAKLVGNSVTVTGASDSAQAKAAAAAAAKATWPNAVVVDDIGATASGVDSSPSTPAPATAGGCATLQADITALLKTPITFDTNGFSLAPGSTRVLSQIADKVKACPGAKLAVVGFTDDTGTEAINGPLSVNRAKAVADALVSDGLAATAVASSGQGAANPIADNHTPAGRAQNRRVEITVG